VSKWRFFFQALGSFGKQSCPLVRGILEASESPKRTKTISCISLCRFKLFIAANSGVGRFLAGRAKDIHKTQIIYKETITYRNFLILTFPSFLYSLSLRSDCFGYYQYLRSVVRALQQPCLPRPNTIQTFWSTRMRSLSLVNKTEARQVRKMMRLYWLVDRLFYSCNQEDKLR
jgi:hypothetical protein